MRSFTSLALAAAALSVGVSAATDERSSNDTISCVDGLYMLVARGTGEDPGPGESGKVARRIADRVNGSAVVGLDYPAVFNGEVGDDNYFNSVEKGYESMKKAIEDYHDKCPDGRMAVFGYSQGAQISSDALCGGSGGWFNSDSEPVDVNIIEKSVAAIVLFGDPSYVRDASYSRGTGDRNGIFEREDDSLERCNVIGSRVVSYCDEGDYFCGTSIFKINSTVHVSYVEIYGDEVVDLVVSAYDDFKPEFQHNVTGLADEDAHTNSDEDDDGAASTLVPSLFSIGLLMIGVFHVLL